jgi:hypothetical protein
LMSSTTCLNHFVLGHPIGLFTSNFNYNSLLIISILSFFLYMTKRL